MAPIHESGLKSELGERRWEEAEWRDFELWERLEQQFKRRRRNWILATVGLFLILSAVPTVLERLPKWSGGQVALELSRQWNQAKHEAVTLHAPVRIRLDRNSPVIEASVERVESCDQRGVGQWIRSFGLLPADSGRESKLTLLDPDRGSSMGVPSLTTDICYDPLQGAFGGGQRIESLVGIGFLPADDLREEKLDHLTTVLVKGPSGEMIFD